jgi:hypothetical protein
VKDGGIQAVARELKYLEDLDIGGTNVTGETLTLLCDMCLNLRRVNICGCKQLNVSDDQVLRRHRINVEAGEDVFRFYLFPDDASELPRITSSVLKTRGTLSMNKVFKYLIKKLISEKAIEDVPDEIQADFIVEILCNGVVLNPFMQLKVVRERYWAHQPPEQLLRLHYRKREENPAEAQSKGQSVTISSVSLSQSISASSSSQQQQSNLLRYLPRKPPMWVPSHLAVDCSGCAREFHWFARRVHHCRNCGKCFCKGCTAHLLKLPEYGYLNPVRVCSHCKDEIVARDARVNVSSNGGETEGSTE